MKQKIFFKKLFLDGVYDPRINQGMMLSLATGLLYLGFFLCGQEGLAIFSIIALLPSLMASVDKPGLHFSLRFFIVVCLFFGVSSLVIFFSRSGLPLVLLFFPLFFVLAMFAVYGNEAGRVGTGAMFVAALSLSWPPANVAWIFPLLISLGTLWYGICARLWMLWWGHRVLRDILAGLFAAIGDYYTLKTGLLLGPGTKEELAVVYAAQEKVYELINQSKAYLHRYDEGSYDRELKKLKQNFLFAVDIMELLQANQHRLEEIRQFISDAALGRQFSDMSSAVVARLKKKAFGVRTRRNVVLKMNVALQAFELSLLAAGKEAESPLVRSLVLQMQALKTLLGSQKPAFDRPLGVAQAAVGFVATFRPHLNFSSPPFRYALRLAVTISCGLLLAGVMELDKKYWVLLAILLVMQSGYLLTKTMISKRVTGTLSGVLLALLLLQLPMGRGMLLVLCLLLAIFSFSMVFYHKTWTIIGVTALVILGYQLGFESGEEVIFVRLVDSLLGCALAFVSNILLWPQWHGGGMERLIRETLLAQEDILVFCIRSLSDRSIRAEQLTRRRLRLYTAQNNLLASYQQMLREPQHTRECVDSLDRVLSHFVATAAHINALLPMIREITPMSADLTAHMERAVVAMFGCCDDHVQRTDITLQEELKIIYAQLDKLQSGENDPQHFAVIHLLELIYERLHAIFEILDFCSPQEASIRQ